MQRPERSCHFLTPMVTLSFVSSYMWSLSGRGIVGPLKFAILLRSSINSAHCIRKPKQVSAMEVTKSSMLFFHLSGFSSGHS